MRIALLTTDSRDLIRRYDCKEPSFGAAPEALLEGFQLIPEIEVHVVSCTRHPMRSPDRLAPNIFFHSVFVPRIGWLRTGYRGCIRAVRTKLNEIQPDFVHGQGTERDCAMSAVFSGFPNVVTIHGNMGRMARLSKGKERLFLWLAALLENIVLRRTDGVFCNSSFTEHIVKPHTRRTWRVANAIRKIFLETPLSFENNGPKILNVGSVSRHKRQLELLSLANKLHHEGLKFQLRFVGAVSPDRYGKAFLEKINAPETRAFASHREFVDSAEMLHIYDSAAALVHVSLEESFGLVVAEGLARNLKFFGNRVGGVPDIATGVESAELFAADNWDGMRGAIKEWAVSGCARPKSAAAVISERYHPKHIARQHVEIYEEILRTDL
jgi:glycosyltransferase involved in cell wall biosynthesis